jgi:spore maturation protein CgeB
MSERRRRGLELVVAGLSITSSWGNGHATTYRALVRELARLGHRVTFLERDVPWYAEHRDAPNPVGCEVVLYENLRDLARKGDALVRRADVVIVGSYVPDGIAVARWVLDIARGIRAFYDIDTPVTLRKLERGEHEYIEPALVPRFDLYLSFTGGPTLDVLERLHGSPAARHLACSVDPQSYRPTRAQRRYALGYLGTYSEDRQPILERLLVEPARRLRGEAFVVGGASYPKHLTWPRNIERIEHVPPSDHPAFYCAQRATLNVTRADMVAAGYSPSVRLFEAAACGVPILSDRWPGIDRYFDPGSEIVLVDDADDVLRALQDIPSPELSAIGRRARARVLRDHTAAARARELLGYVGELGGGYRAVG